MKSVSGPYPLQLYRLYQTAKIIGTNTNPMNRASGGASSTGSSIWTGVLSRYLRNWAQAGSAAPVVQEKPSPPPITAVGSPWPPDTAGNANQPSLASTLLSVVSPWSSTGSQSPCSSIATLPLA